MFNDYTKGPTLSVIVIGLFVLAGFIGLGAYAVSDKNDKPEVVIAAQENQIARQKEILAQEQSRAEKSKKRHEAKVELDQIEKNTTDTKEALRKTKEEIATKQNALNSLLAKKEVALKKVRMKVRTAAVGQTIESLTTRSGKVYKNAKIRKVTPYGISITDGYKLKTIPPSELPEEFTAMYHFDEKETQEALEKLEQFKAERLAKRKSLTETEERNKKLEAHSESKAEGMKIRKTISDLRIKIDQYETKIDSMNRERRALMAKHHQSRGENSERTTNSTFSKKALGIQDKINEMREYVDKLHVQIQSYYNQLSSL